MLYFVIIAVILILTAYCLWWKPKQADNYYNQRTLWFAHRGTMLHEPENTLASFICAVELGFPAIEVDVVSTKDGVVICSHNFDLERKTNGYGYIHKKDYPAVKNLKVVGPAENKREQISTLNQVLDMIKEPTSINIEIKTSKWLDFKTAWLVGNLIKEKNLKNRVMVSTFNALTLCFIHLFFRSINTGYIVNQKYMIPPIHFAKPDFIHPRGDLISVELIKYAKQKGLRINAWTINTKPAIEWLEKQGVDGIITDRLEFFKK